MASQTAMSCGSIGGVRQAATGPLMTSPSRSRCTVAGPRHQICQAERNNQPRAFLLAVKVCQESPKMPSKNKAHIRKGSRSNVVLSSPRNRKMQNKEHFVLGLRNTPLKDS